MSRSNTYEALLISCIINSGDARAAQNLGVAAKHFHAYQQEYQWILSFNANHAGCPSASEFLSHYPHFPLKEDANSATFAATKVKEEWASRDMRDRLLRAHRAMDRNDVHEAFEAFQGARIEATTPRPPNALEDHRFLDDYESDYEPRIPVPWGSLEGRTQGIGPGELWYFAARQGHGKSSFLIDMAVEAAVAGRKVVFYSLEMTKRQCQVRIHAALGNRLKIPVDAQAMLRRTWPALDYKELLQRIQAEVPGSIHIHEVSMGLVTPAVVDTNAEHFDISFVDYVGLMRNDDHVPAIKDYRIIAEISNGLKSTALGRYHSIVAASQINREGVGSSWRPPALHTLAQSDHLGNDGDVVITMKRYGKGASVCSLEKNRHGQSGVNFFTKYDANNGDFREIPREKADEIKSEDEEY